MKRKPDSCGHVNAYCSNATSKTRMKRMRDGMEMAAALAEVSRMNAEDAKEKKAGEAQALTDAAPSALLKLAEKAGDLTKLFVGELKSIAHTHFMQAELKGKKSDCIKQLQSLIDKNPNILPLVSDEAQRNK